MPSQIPPNPAPSVRASWLWEESVAKEKLILEREISNWENSFVSFNK